MIAVVALGMKSETEKVPDGAIIDVAVSGGGHGDRVGSPEPVTLSTVPLVTSKSEVVDRGRVDRFVGGEAELDRRAVGRIVLAGGLLEGEVGRRCRRATMSSVVPAVVCALPAMSSTEKVPEASSSTSPSAAARDGDRVLVTGAGDRVDRCRWSRRNRLR